MFEVGKLVARIALEGTQVFRDDVRKIGREFGNLSSEGREAMSKIGTGLVAVGASIIGLASIAVARFASFDKAMSQVSATTGAGAAEMDKLRQSAIEAGATSVFTAEEAADAQNELAKAGVATANIMGGGLAGSLALAAAGQIGVAEAAEVAATAMTQFRLSGEEIPHLADLLSAGANQAQGGVMDLSMALKQSGLVASQMGLSVEETIGTLSAFASAGLIGSDAGTSFRTMLLSLANPSKEAADALKRYNIEAYDLATGEFVGLPALQEQVRAGFKGVKDSTRDAALATIFGSDAIRAANVLYAESDKTIAEWTESVDDSGAAARTAAELQNNLAGDVEKLGGAFDAALISTGEGANGMLRDMVQLLTMLVDGYNALDPSVQQFGLVLGVGVGALALFVGGIVLAIPKIVEFRLALRTLNQEVPALQKGLKGVGGFLGGPWGFAIAAATAILGAFIQEQVEAAQKAQAYAETLDSSTNRITAATREMTKANLAAKSGWWFIESDSAYDAAEQLGIGLDLITDAASGNADAMREVNGILKERSLLSEADSNATHRVSEAIRGESGSIEEAIRIAEQKEAVDEATGRSNEYVAGTYDDTSTSVEGLTLNINELIESLNKANGVAIDAEEANIKYANQLREIAAAATKSNAGISLSTVEGTKNRAMLLDLAKAGQDVAQANLEAGGTAEEYTATLEASRAAWVKQAIALGATAKEANALADEIYRIPTTRETQIVVNTQQAEGTLSRFFRKYDGKRLTTYVNGVVESVRTGDKIAQANGGIVEYYANGGMRENHIAQIARAGTTRVWAEPETGGEAYIPLSPAKRPRALEVLGEVASMFGLGLTANGGEAADGGSSAPSGVTRAMRISGKLDIGGVLVDLIDAELEEYDLDNALNMEGR